MATATFPDGVSKEIPPEKTPVQQAVEDIVEVITGPMMDLINGLEKVNDYAAAGRRVDCDH